MGTPLAPSMHIRIQNDSEEVIPPRSIVVVNSVEMVDLENTEEFLIHHVGKYVDGSTKNIFVTGPRPVAVGEETGDGLEWENRSVDNAFYDPLIYIAIDPEGPNPVAGEEWGPEDGEWFVTHEGEGFIAQGYVDFEFGIKRAMFMRKGGGGESTSTPSGGGGCACCDCRDCITAEEATVESCAACPENASIRYRVNFGEISLYPELGGTQYLTHDTGCIWKSPTIEVTDGVDTGEYEWVFTADGIDSELELVLTSGDDIVGL